MKDTVAHANRRVAGCYRHHAQMYHQAGVDRWFTPNAIEYSNRTGRFHTPQCSFVVVRTFLLMPFDVISVGKANQGRWNYQKVLNSSCC
ncbi:hypothetical protein AVEN_40915-1 [Araneus ventricosus]|uniref:Uncharacterized protein n=1 Tax=Araneus ventricosus TaxID=182803 RepID=A0A4Y2UCT1_ARAVE|nr:hypothetical protein AVEN_40915-1 [Araneus ventricosus]